MESTFHGVIAFALMVSMLVIGSLLRRQFGFLQRSLVPACIIGGLIGFALLSFGLVPGYTPGDFVSLTFHFFTLSFMSLCLTGTSKDETLSGGSIARGGMWLSLIWTASLGLQAVLGYGLIVLYDKITGSDIVPLLGALITHGFTQGPGQALSYGNLWEQNYGMTNAAQVGMIYASLGFLMAFIVGVPAAKHIIKTNRNVNKKSSIDKDFLLGFYRKEHGDVNMREVTHSSNMDSFAWHISLLGVAYVLTHLYIKAMQVIIEGKTPLGISLDVFFNHNLFFVHGMVVCVIMRYTIDKMGWSHFINDATMKRITGASVDFMVVGTVMSISFAVLYALLLSLIHI